MQQHQQFAALPFVEVGGQTRVLLISSRETGRWIIPKGWPKAGLQPHEIAAEEAYEEAGVRGDVGHVAIGSFGYTKRLHLLAWVRCNVGVFPLHVDRQHLKWQEKASRKQLWLSPSEAASRVNEPGLAAILATFTAAQITAQPTSEA